MASVGFPFESAQNIAKGRGKQKRTCYFHLSGFKKGNEQNENN
jgi:hypothetical protein